MSFKRIEKLLKDENTTIYGVSKATGIPNSTLYEWQQGKHTPKVDKLIKIADHYGIPLEELVRKE